MTKSLNSRKINKEWLLGKFFQFIFWLTLLIGIYGFAYHFYPSPIEEIGSFLSKRDSLQVSPEIVRSQVQALKQETLQQYTICINISNSLENRRMQELTLYIVILVALITMALTGKESRDNREMISMIGIIFIIIMYLYDVHSNDVFVRSTRWTDWHTKTYHDLVAINPDVATWYTLDYLKTDPSKADSNKEFTSFSFERLKRKGIAASRPTIEQTYFYLFPLMMFCWLWRRHHPRTEGF